MRRQLTVVNLDSTINVHDAADRIVADPAGGLAGIDSSAWQPRSNL